jgi:hypothetical protein
MSNLERFFRIWGLIVIITSFGDMVLHAITDKDIWVYIFYAHFGIFICSVGCTVVYQLLKQNRNE